MYYAYPTEEFQFHKGTIKTSRNRILCTNHKHFNSIKVRLKQSRVAETLSSVVFQFHKGTIKTLYPLQSDILDSYFNSIKVRLKPVKSKVYKPRRLYRFAGAKIQKNLQKNVDA